MAGALTRSWQGDLRGAAASRGAAGPGPGGLLRTGRATLAPAGLSAALPPGKAARLTPVRTAAPWTCPPPLHHLLVQGSSLPSQSQGHSSGERPVVGLLSPAGQDPECCPESLITLGFVRRLQRRCRARGCPHRAAGWAGQRRCAEHRAPGWPTIRPVALTDSGPQASAVRTWRPAVPRRHSASCAPRARWTGTGDVSPVHRVRLCLQVALGGAGRPLPSEEMWSLSRSPQRRDQCLAWSGLCSRCCLGEARGFEVFVLFV